MSDVHSNIYWIDEFEITTADLDRIATRIRETGQAHDLTALARRLVRGRLHYGPEMSAPARAIEIRDPSVRLWDPAMEWRVGNHVIVAHRIPKTDVFEARIGEITAVEPEQVRMHIDGVEKPITYQLADPGSVKAKRWHAKVREVVAKKRKAPQVEDQIEIILLTHGERIGSQLLEALRADERFVRLTGRWFLYELAVFATDEQLAALAWAMISLEAPQATADLVSLVEPPLAKGDPGIFGLYLAMRERDDLFANAAPGQRPRWKLAGPPPGPFTPRHAAYDPESYEVLCLPDCPVSQETVKRLWESELLQAVV